MGWGCGGVYGPCRLKFEPWLALGLVSSAEYCTRDVCSMPEGSCPCFIPPSGNVNCRKRDLDVTWTSSCHTLGRSSLPPPFKAANLSTVRFIYLLRMQMRYEYWSHTFTTIGSQQPMLTINTWHAPSLSFMAKTELRKWCDAVLLSLLDGWL